MYTSAIVSQHRAGGIVVQGDSVRICLHRHICVTGTTTELTKKEMITPIESNVAKSDAPSLLPETSAGYSLGVSGAGCGLRW